MAVEVYSLFFSPILTSFMSLPDLRTPTTGLENLDFIVLPRLGDSEPFFGLVLGDLSRRIISSTFGLLSLLVEDPGEIDFGEAVANFSSTLLFRGDPPSESESSMNALKSSPGDFTGLFFFFAGFFSWPPLYLLR